MTSIDSLSRHLDKLFINGEWVKPSTSDTLKIVSPVTEELIGEVAEAHEADVDKAVAAARDAFDNGSWPRLSPKERAVYIQKLADLLRSRTADLSAAWVAQIGALESLAKLVTPGGIAPLDNAVQNADNFQFLEKRESKAAAAGYLAYEPVGVVACIAPWNLPIVTMLNKMGPALLTGCTVIMKPAPQTPLEAYIIAECAEHAGFPPGVINLITSERDASDYLVQQEGVDKVAFTGSVAAGQRIASVCGERIARVTLELGGKSPGIILDDYDLETAATTISQHIASLSGQNCAALTRIIISRDRHDEFVALLSEKLRALKVGLPSDPEVQVGPLAMQRQLQQVERYIAKGQEEGATLVCGGKRPEHLDKGCFIEPTLFANVDNSMAIAQEEIFGPVISVIPCDSEDEAVEIANDSRFGLAGTVFTNDAQKAYEISRRVRTGTMAQNGALVDFSIGFGGFKRSGLGREGGLEGLKSYMELKTVLLAEDAAVT